MSKFSKTLVAMILLSSVATSFAQAAATYEEIHNCMKLKDQAEAHSEWSDALDRLTSSNRLSEDQLRPIYKNSIKKISNDIYDVRELAGLTEEDRETTVLDEADDLLKAVKKNNHSTSKANDLMKEKLFELDDEMFKTIRAAEKNISNCRLGRGSGSSSNQSDEDAEDSVN